MRGVGDGLLSFTVLRASVHLNKGRCSRQIASLFNFNTMGSSEVDNGENEFQIIFTLCECPMRIKEWDQSQHGDTAYFKL